MQKAHHTDSTEAKHFAQVYQLLHIVQVTHDTIPILFLTDPKKIISRPSCKLQYLLLIFS